jgi:hypothetical protein
VGAENQNRTNRNFLDGLDKYGAAPPQLVHDVAVMHNFVMNINGIAVGFERQLHNVNRSDHARAESPRTDSYQRLGAVIGSMNRSQRQCDLRKALSFYLNRCFPATSFAFLVLEDVRYLAQPGADVRRAKTRMEDCFSANEGKSVRRR